MVLAEPIKTTTLVLPPEMPPVARVLWNARQYITPREKWTAGFYHDRYTGAACAIGSISSGNKGVVEYKYQQRANRFLQSYAKKTEARCVESFNDNHGHKEVLEFFDRAIQLALELGK